MDLPSYFADFLHEIRPRKDQLADLRSAQKTLRERIKEDEDLAAIYISDFLQGSYRRSTAIRPLGEDKADVDVIVVTNLDHLAHTPDQALNRFAGFLNRHYQGKWKKQGRSIQIELSKASLDLVVTAAPSQAQKSRYLADSVRTSFGIEDLEDWTLVPSWPDLERRSSSVSVRLLEAARKEAAWKMEPLLIPDRDAKCWQPTDPLTQIQWTWDKNKSCNRHYVNVVKAIKWWRRAFEKPKYPKSYPLEHLIGDVCPDGITSVAQGVTYALEGISQEYQKYVDAGSVPYLRDRGVDQNVFLRITPEDFALFHSLVKGAAVTAREAFDAKTEARSAAAWRQLFGDRFPEGPEEPENDEGSGNEGKGGYSSRTGPTVIVGGRFA